MISEDEQDQVNLIITITITKSGGSRLWEKEVLKTKSISHKYGAFSNKQSCKSLSSSYPVRKNQTTINQASD